MRCIIVFSGVTIFTDFDSVWRFISWLGYAFDCGVTLDSITIPPKILSIIKKTMSKHQSPEQLINPTRSQWLSSFDVVVSRQVVINKQKVKSNKSQVSKSNHH
eukprot:TRINITY_DN13339_c0_g1_i1.p1 TRINITY_DN13339_c0_g1~~TRINITY_DN13339_c0_g1_i1.p1  ORF type:complete len:103 (-),score=5.50 TRINITY_DN13339_c0_g1_i1:209-517(-)